MDIKENVSLAPLTTLGVGGQAEYFAAVTTKDELATLASEAKRQGQTVTILGGGSNVLISDEGLKGLVIKIEIKGITHAASNHDDEKVLVTSGAGEIWDDLVDYTVTNGLWGMENLSAIPGTVGATPIQNVGAYGVEVGSLIESVEVYSLKTGEFSRLSNSDCRFGYRDSFLKSTAGRDLVVVFVNYLLSTKANPQLHYQDLAKKFQDVANPTQQDIRTAVTEIRGQKFPDWKQIGTAGSFFKNPIITASTYQELRIQYPELPGFPEPDGKVKVSLGWILDKVCDLKGARAGNVGTYARQALVLVNYGGATAAEVKSFAREVAQKVLARTSIRIEPEVNFL
jgi:UDP-N-acetylmuramate dehydrogenase